MNQEWIGEYNIAHGEKVRNRGGGGGGRRKAGGGRRKTAVAGRHPNERFKCVPAALGVVSPWNQMEIRAMEYEAIGEQGRRVTHIE